MCTYGEVAYKETSPVAEIAESATDSEALRQKNAKVESLKRELAARKSSGHMELAIRAAQQLGETYLEIAELARDGAGTGKLWLVTPDSRMAREAVADAVGAEVEHQLRAHCDAIVHHARLGLGAALQGAVTNFSRISVAAAETVLAAKVTHLFEQRVAREQRAEAIVEITRNTRVRLAAAEGDHRRSLVAIAEHKSSADIDADGDALQLLDSTDRHHATHICTSIVECLCGMVARQHVAELLIAQAKVREIDAVKRAKEER